MPRNPHILQRPLPYKGSFYIHSMLLHLSLLLRIAGDLGGSYAAYQWGGLFNVLAVLQLGARRWMSGSCPVGHRPFCFAC